MNVLLILALVGSSFGLLFEPSGYANRYKDVIFEYHKSHNLMLVKNNVMKDCYLIRVDDFIRNLFTTKEGRYIVEDDIYRQIQSQTDETKIQLPQITKDFGDYLAQAECRNDVIYELKFTPPTSSSATTAAQPDPTSQPPTARPTTPPTTTIVV